MRRDFLTVPSALQLANLPPKAERAEAGATKGRAQGGRAHPKNKEHTTSQTTEECALSPFPKRDIAKAGYPTGERKTGGTPPTAVALHKTSNFKFTGARCCCKFANLQVCDAGTHNDRTCARCCLSAFPLGLAASFCAKVWLMSRTQCSPKERN